MTTAASSPSSPSSRPAEPKSAHDARTTQRSRVLIPRLASDSSGPARWAAMPVHSIGRCAGSQAAFPPGGQPPHRCPLSCALFSRRSRSSFRTPRSCCMSRNIAPGLRAPSRQADISASGSRQPAGSGVSPAAARLRGTRQVVAGAGWGLGLGAGADATSPQARHRR